MTGSISGTSSTLLTRVNSFQRRSSLPVCSSKSISPVEILPNGRWSVGITTAAIGRRPPSLKKDLRRSRESQGPTLMGFGPPLTSKVTSYRLTTCNPLLLFNPMAHDFVWIERRITLSGVSAHCNVLTSRFS